MYNFESFGLRQMIESSRALRQLGRRSHCLEEAASEIVDFFFESFRVAEGNPACALVRCFKTHAYRDLPEPLRFAASSSLHGADVGRSTPCLTLLSTRGVHSAWNSRHTSSGHRAIPLATAEMVAQAPMISNLMQQMGVNPIDLLQRSADNRDALDNRALDVFHIEHALGSAFVPAQTSFVQPYGIQSVVGFGGVLPNGELFFVVVFTTVPVSSNTAAMFRTLALSTKLVLLRHMDEPVFAV